MPTLGYLSMRHEPIFTDDWQIYVFFSAVVIVMIVLVLWIKSWWKL